MARRGGPRTAGQWLSSTLALIALIAVAAGCGGSNTGHKPAGGQQAPDLVVATPASTPAAFVATTTTARTPSPTATPSATPSPTPTSTPTASPTATPAPRVEALADGAHGYAASSGAVVQAEPTTKSAVVAHLSVEQPLNLRTKVRGENVVVGAQTWYIAGQDWQNLWYQVDGGYVYAAYVWLPRAGETLPSQLSRGERWVSVDLASQTAKAMIGDTAVYTAPVTTGKDGYETPTGHWRVGYQVLNETMTSGQAGINDPAEHYDVHNVLFTQYFDGDGDALHLNYWQPDSVFGNARTSHGCVGLYLRDAQFMWMFGQQGMRVEITANGRILAPPAPPPAAAPTPRRTASPTPRPAAPRTTPTPQPPLATTPAGVADDPQPRLAPTPTSTAVAVNSGLPPLIQAALQATPTPTPPPAATPRR